ncbi:MAG: pyrimidine dimer DNA glycosylase/endonuclease V [Nevskiaceae bacterium]
MRLWTLHPKYLDARGLVALWREGLLAQKVLQGRTRGYRHHPQLDRFKAQADPVASITRYLRAVQEEATRRGYRFTRSKIARRTGGRCIKETRGQLAYEWEHLARKLRQRAPEHHRSVAVVRRPQPHPLFTLIRGGVRDWERPAAGPRRAVNL